MTTWPFLSHGRGHRTGTVLTQSFRTIFRRLQTSASSPGAICTAGAGGREGTVTCFASETTELTATEKPSLRCEPRPEPACSRTRATSSPSHALPGPPRAAPATLPRPWAADRPGSRAPFWRDRQAALTQRLLPPCPPPSLPAGGGTWHRPLWKLCSLPTRTQTVLGKEADRGSTTAQPLRPLRTQTRGGRRGSPTGLLSSFASVVLPQSALTPSTATRRRKAPAALCCLSSLSTTPTASVAFLARVVPCGREAAVARGPGHHAGQAPAEADAGSVVSPTCSTTSPSGRPFSVLSRLFQTYFSWVFI